MCGESAVARVLQYAVFAGLATVLGYGDFDVDTSGTGGSGDDWESHHSSNATIPELTESLDESAKWMADLRSSLMRDNYDYLSPEEEPLGRRDAELGTSEAGDTSEHASDTSEHASDTSEQSNGDSSSSHSDEQNGSSYSQGSDNPTPRSLNHDSPVSEDQQWKHGSSKAQPGIPIQPPRPSPESTGQHTTHADLLGSGAATVKTPSRRADDPAWEHGISWKDVHGPDANSAETTLPRVTDNARLLAELDKEFEMRRQGYLESLYELEDQLRPMYMGGSPNDKDSRGAERPHVGRRGESHDIGFRNALDGKYGIKSKKATGLPPYVDANDGIRRYKVDKNDLQKFPSFGDINSMSLYDTNVPRHKARFPGHKKRHELAHIEKDSGRDETISLGYLGHRKKPRHHDLWGDDRLPKPLGANQAHGGHKKQRKKHYSQHKEFPRKSRYLQSAHRPKFDHDGSFIQRYASRRDEELLADTFA